MSDEACKLEESILSSAVAWRGSFLSADEITVKLPNGKEATRDVIRHPGAVGIVALTDDSQIVLVRQYRIALERETLEIPAGKIDTGEDPALTAARELKEECGVVANKMSYLTSIATSVGFSDELLHLYMATDLHFEMSEPDEDEFVILELMPLEELIELVLDGQIEDSKTIIGALLCDAIAHRLG
ncbi:MAG: NUDIX hydrolase [Coriobacteriia bacterium]|nr:NUDIX hydrolase [Coriobacteriia bacterium]